jgi:hypothetical protein
MFIVSILRVQHQSLPGALPIPVWFENCYLAGIDKPVYISQI